jgi:YbbR domain-containing protein
MKLVALVITLGLWFGVTGLSTPTTKRLTIPLSPSISNNTQITNSLIPDVDIVISGDKRKIDQINKSELVASLDLTDVAPGDRVVSLTPENVFVSLPQGVKLVEIAPTRIAVNLEAVLEKDVDVRAETTGQPAAGFEIYGTSTLPPRIRVRGPASVVNMLEYVLAGEIDVTAKAEEFTARQVAVSSPNPKAAVLNTVVDVFVRIGERRIERTFSKPIAGSFGQTASFTVYGPKTLLSKVRADAFKIEMPNVDGDGSPELILPRELENLVEIKKLTVK